MQSITREMWRQVSVTFIVLTLVCQPISIAGQSGEQKKENRGLGITNSTTKTSDSDQPTSDAKPEIIIQASHTKPINAIAFAPDARWLASGANDDTVKIWDTSTGHLLRTLYGHSSNVKRARRKFRR